MKVRLPRAPVSFCESATLLSDAGAPALADARAPAAVEECLEGARTCGCPAGEEIRQRAALSFNFFELAFCKTLKNLINRLPIKYASATSCGLELELLDERNCSKT